MENQKHHHHTQQHQHHQNGHPHHHEHHDHSKMHHGKVETSEIRLAVSATLHCLLGCGIGEVAGMIISTALNLNNLPSIILSIVLGFIAGLVLGMRPLRKHGFTFNNALKTVLISEGLSIAVMEAFEVLTEVSIPGVMNAHLGQGIFWIGMMAALTVGFIAALPVNYILVKRGVRHQH
jgi:putative flippase GtrA